MSAAVIAKMSAWVCLSVVRMAFIFEHFSDGRYIRSLRTIFVRRIKTNQRILKAQKSVRRKYRSHGKYLSGQNGPYQSVSTSECITQQRRVELRVASVKMNLRLFHPVSPPVSRCIRVIYTALAI